MSDLWTKPVRNNLIKSPQLDRMIQKRYAAQLVEQVVIFLHLDLHFTSHRVFIGTNVRTTYVFEYYKIERGYCNIQELCLFSPFVRFWVLGRLLQPLHSPAGNSFSSAFCRCWQLGFFGQIPPSRAMRYPLQPGEAQEKHRGEDAADGHVRGRRPRGPGDGRAAGTRRVGGGTAGAAGE